MRPQAPGLPFDGPPFYRRPAPRISAPVFHVVGTWGGRHAGRIQMGGKERHHPLCLPGFNISLTLTEYCDSVKIRLLIAHCRLPASTTSGRSPGLPGDHRAAPDPGRPPLEAVVPRQQSGRRSATSQGCRAQGLGGAVVFFLEASSKERGRPDGAYALQLVGLDPRPR